MDNELDLAAEQPELSDVNIDQARAACSRYRSSRRFEPGSAADRHLRETGHELGFGCCVAHSGDVDLAGDVY